MTGQIGGRPRPSVKLWTCALCEREVIAASTWRDHAFAGGAGIIYFHGDGEQCFVANQAFVSVVSQIGEIDEPR